MYKKILTSKATIFTVDINGQNSSASKDMLKILIQFKDGIIPPNTTIIKIVNKVSLNPQIVYVCCGPLFGLGCPLTVYLGKNIDARQIYK